MADSKKAKRLSKEETKNHLLDPMIIDENLLFNDLNKEAEEIIKTKKKRIINIAFD